MQKRIPLISITSIIALIVFSIVSRMIFLPESLGSINAIQHTLALQDYDVLRHTPHPPGAPTYHAVLRFIYALCHECEAIYIPLIAGIILSSFAGLAAYGFGKWMISTEGSAKPFLLGLLLLITPPLWLDSIAGGSSAGDAGLAALLGIFCIRSRLKGLMFDVVAGAITLGILIGFRQNVNLASLSMLPLWLWSIWPTSLQKRFVGVGALVGACAAWAIPTFLACGGWELWMKPTIDHFLNTSMKGLLIGKVKQLLIGHLSLISFAKGSLISLKKVAGLGMREAWMYVAMLWIPVTYIGFRYALSSKLRRSLEFRFTCWWVLPMMAGASIAPYHLNEYYAVLMPIICYWATVGLTRLSERLGSLFFRLGIARSLPRSASVSAFFLAGATIILVFHSSLFLKTASDRSIRAEDRYKAMLREIDREFDPSKTMILIGSYGQRYASLHLPKSIAVYLPFLEGKVRPYAGSVFIDGVEQRFDGNVGTVPTQRRTIQTVVITEKFQSVSCVPPLSLKDHKGMFLYVQAKQEGIVVQYTHNSLTLKLAEEEKYDKLAKRKIENEAEY